MVMKMKSLCGEDDVNTLQLEAVVHHSAPQTRCHDFWRYIKLYICMYHGVTRELQTLETQATEPAVLVTDRQTDGRTDSLAW